MLLQLTHVVPLDLVAFVVVVLGRAAPPHPRIVGHNANVAHNFRRKVPLQQGRDELLAQNVRVPVDAATILEFGLVRVRRHGDAKTAVAVQRRHQRDKGGRRPRQERFQRRTAPQATPTVLRDGGAVHVQGDAANLFAPQQRETGVDIVLRAIAAAVAAGCFFFWWGRRHDYRRSYSLFFDFVCLWDHRETGERRGKDTVALIIHSLPYL